jgi:26S proteasome regulatory subunit, ATPase 3, interacting protein
MGKKKAKPENIPSEEATENKSEELSNEETLVLDYMIHQNRPYNALNIHDNLRGAIKKPQCQKILDKLVDIGKLQAKEYGKVKIYLVNQKLIPEVNDSELEQLDTQIKELSEDTELLKNEIKDLQMQAKELESSLTLEEIDKQLQDNIKAINQLHQDIDDLNNQGCVSDAMKKDIEDKLKVIQIEEKKRFKVYKNILDGIAEMTDQPVKKVKELIGIEE